MACVDSKSVFLQGKALTLKQEKDAIESLMEALNRIRGSWTSLLEEAKLVATNLDIDTEFKRRIRKKKLPFGEKQVPLTESPEDFKFKVFIPSIDELLGQCKERFAVMHHLCDVFEVLFNPEADVGCSNQKQATVHHGPRKTKQPHNFEY